MSEDKKDFTAADEQRSAETGAAEEPADKSPREKEGAAAREKGGAPDGRLPKIDFATFVFSLNSAVLVHLGIMDDPATGQPAKHLPLAKQTIDVLGMLEEKTRGNLTSDEENMLKNILYDLRIRYVRETG
jgi:hypothetical protein